MIGRLSPRGEAPGLPLLHLPRPGRCGADRGCCPPPVRPPSGRMIAHVRRPGSVPLLVFPEGTCVNNEYCVMFKKVKERPELNSRGGGPPGQHGFSHQGTRDGGRPSGALFSLPRSHFF